MSDEERLDGLLSLADVAGDTRIGDPEEEGLAELRELGKGLANGLFQSLRILSMHEKENEAVIEPLERLRASLEALFRHSSSVHFITVEGQIYLNDLRIKMDASAYSNMVYLLGRLERHGVGGITFGRPPSRDELKDLVLLLLETKPPAEGDALDHLNEQLTESGLQGITFDRPYFFKAGDTTGFAAEEEEEKQEVAALSYAKGVLAVKDYFRAVEAAEAANPLRIRKIVHDLVDVADDEPESFLKLHTIHGVEDAYYNHCVNVATLAVTLGKALGLTRVELADLGSAAMFHDLGYAALERQEAEEQREFSPRDRMRLHPVAGFRSLLGQAEYGPGLLRRLLVTLEHHMDHPEPGGYPELRPRKLSVFTRIVQVADHYDALVTPSGNRPGLLPIKALESIVAASGVRFDPVVVKALVQTVGRYPYGSLVRLNTGEVGVVTSGGRDAARFEKPTVMIVRAGDGSEVEPHLVDLAERDILGRKVAVVLDPHDADLAPHTVLFDRLHVEEEEEEAESAAAFDPEAWNRAIWEGEDTEELITGSMAALRESQIVPVLSEEGITAVTAGAAAGRDGEPEEGDAAHEDDDAELDDDEAELEVEDDEETEFEVEDDDEDEEALERTTGSFALFSQLLDSSDVVDGDADLLEEPSRVIPQIDTEPQPSVGDDDVLAWLDAKLSDAGPPVAPAAEVAPASPPWEAEPSSPAQPPPETPAAPKAEPPPPPSTPLPGIPAELPADLSEAQKNRLIAEAFTEGGEAAVFELMGRLSGEFPTLKE